VKPKATHTSFFKGTPVFVKLRDGRQFKDRFEERRQRFVILTHAGKVANSELASITVYRDPTRQG
jgi:hypothetical protein